MSEFLEASRPDRYARSSVRSARFPMDFTFDELVPGVIVAFVLYQALLIGTLILAQMVTALATWLAGTATFAPPTLEDAMYLLPVFMFSLMASAFACVTYGPALAWLLGKLLRSQSNKWVHRVAFTGLGAAVGVLTELGLIASSAGGISAVNLGDPIFLLMAAPAALAVPLGWEYASSRALRSR
ncbi:hypothetical protein [Leucobacter chromiireducens]|uniref:Uncharacterized protein n=1 Tax=Leucobacter chromiireducens subsp. chromiireducens TaxID=660067 RepID=A0ABS1SQZ5_9MICO|nr:hypothetical protein [Leucobacter chromiireducens]MBL3690518.1 hypothetical protein [Leucobacter chromiireducens subsp. chromiireducens]